MYEKVALFLPFIHYPNDTPYIIPIRMCEDYGLYSSLILSNKLLVSY